MLVCDYIVERIDGDYAMLKRTNLPEEEAKMVARALLPEEIREGSCDLCRTESIGRRLCCTYGCRSQDPPTLLPEMYEILQEDGYDNVATKRVTRTGEPRIRSFLSESFYKFVNAISKTEIVDGARDYRLMKRKMVQAVLEMSEYNRFSKGIFGWVGFRTKWLQYDNIERSAGKTKWSMWKLFKYSVEGITGFSVAPLSLASVVGVLFCVLSFIMIAVIVVRTLVWGDPVSGWPSLACIIFLVSGVQLLCTGIVGEYLSKTYLETKKRPIFILKDSSDDKEQKHERT